MNSKWIDYKIIHTGQGYKLERWKSVTLLRPDPQVIWDSDIDMFGYTDLNMTYRRSSDGGGQWHTHIPTPSEWTVKCQISNAVFEFVVKPMGFKHTGLFPEQIVNWQFMYDKIVAKHSSRDIADESRNAEIRVLNLFGYTGAASVVCAAAGATVCHIDAAKNMVDRCKKNAELNRVQGIRYIVDDCLKFVKREQNRGKKYDAIIMDPPSYGRGPSGEMWRIEDNIQNLVQECVKLLSDSPLFVLINSYTTGLQPLVLQNLLKINLPKGNIKAYEVGLETDDRGIVLPCGCSGLWQSFG